MAKKTVLITGASRGIGLTFVQQYVNAGWTVIAAARTPETSSKLKEAGASKIVQLDVRDEESIARAAKDVEGVAIDLLINNVGILEEGSFETATKDSLLRHFEVNSVAPLLVTRALVGNLRLAAKQRGQAVVASVSSMLGSIAYNSGGQYRSNKMTYGGRYAYRSSKAALNMVTSCLAADLAEDRIAAVVLHPGFVKTDINHNTGVVDPNDSVAGMISVLGGLTQQESGKFFDYQGMELPW